MVRQPLTVGTRVRVTFGSPAYPAYRYGVVELAYGSRVGRCKKHPEDEYAYGVGLLGGVSVMVFCESQCEPV